VIDKKGMEELKLEVEVEAGVDIEAEGEAGVEVEVVAEVEVDSEMVVKQEADSEAEVEVVEEDVVVHTKDKALSTQANNF
jgi:hypothetical protein